MCIVDSGVFSEVLVCPGERGMGGRGGGGKSDGRETGGINLSDDKVLIHNNDDNGQIRIGKPSDNSNNNNKVKNDSNRINQHILSFDRTALYCKSVICKNR